MKRVLEVNTRDDQVLVDRLYSIEEAAVFFELESAHWLRERIRCGELAYVDLNPNGKRAKLRVRASALNALIERYSISASSVLSVAA